MQKKKMKKISHLSYGRGWKNVFPDLPKEMSIFPAEDCFRNSGSGPFRVQEFSTNYLFEKKKDEIINFLFYGRGWGNVYPDPPMENSNFPGGIIFQELWKNCFRYYENCLMNFQETSTKRFYMTSNEKFRTSEVGKTFAISIQYIYT